MIKFFRRIRQQLLIENKFSKYLLYAIGEIVLVVIGILIALQLNQNAEKRNQNGVRQEYYIQLLEDLKKDKEFINNTIELFLKDQKAYNEYLNTYKNLELPPLQVYEHLITLNFISTTLSFNSNTIESLKSSGEIILIPLEIRNKLINLLKLQDKILKSMQLNDTGKNNMLQELGIYRGASTLNRRLLNQPKLKSYLQIDKNLPQIILGLDAVFKWKNFSENESTIDLKKMLGEIETVINMIEKEVKIQP